MADTLPSEQIQMQQDYVAPTSVPKVAGTLDPYPPMQCTECVARWFRETGDAGLYFTRPGNRIRHAKVWLALAREAGYETGTTPRIGAVAVFTGGEFQLYGHVAYVTGVNGSTIDVRECNWPIPLFVLREHIGSYPADKPAGYIYAKNSNAAPAITQQPRLEMAKSAPAKKDAPVTYVLKPAPGDKHNAVVTAFNPVPGQNTPSCKGLGQCRGATGIMMAAGHIALSRDMLKPNGVVHPDGEYSGLIPVGARVHLSSDDAEPRCTGDFTVTSTMNVRYTRRADVFVPLKKDNFSCLTGTVTLIE